MSVLASSVFPKRVVVSGYYGFNNLGDELILRVLLEALKARDAKVTVLSAQPDETMATYSVSSVSRTKPDAIFNALRKADLFISGGGGLFQDVTGPTSPIYYGGLLRLAAICGTRTGYWAQGAGPLTTTLGRLSTAFSLGCCQNVIVRDEKSAQLLRDLPGGKIKPEVSADPVWLFDPQAYLASAGVPMIAPSNSEAPTLRVGISLRHWHTLTDTGLMTLAAAVYGYARQQSGTVEVALLPFQDNEDSALLNSFSHKLKQAGFQGQIKAYRPETALAALCQCTVLLGMRFHSLILGLLAGVRVYGLPYDPKVSTLLEDFTLAGTKIESLHLLSADALSEALDTHYPAIDLAPFKARAQRNLTVLDEWLAD